MNATWRVVVMVLPMIAMSTSGISADEKPKEQPEPKVEFSLKDVPNWANHDGFKTEQCIAAAIKLQALGRKKACGTLLELSDLAAIARNHEARLKANGLTDDKLRAAIHRAMRGESDQREGIFILCRMLFTARAGGVFRKPALGAPVYIGWHDAFLVKEAPIEPIEIVDGVPFLIVHGYALGGQAEALKNYVKYCIEECDWNSTSYKPKTAAEKTRAIVKLVGYLRFRGNLPEYEEEFLASQIN